MAPSRMTMCRHCGTLNRVVANRAGARCGRCHEPLEAPAGGGGGGAAVAARAVPVDVDDATFRREVLESPLPVLLDCWAAWCGPCRALAPILSALAGSQAGKLKVCKLDVEAAPATAQALQVMALPTLIAFRDGQAVGRQMGMQPEARLTAWLEGLGMV